MASFYKVSIMAFFIIVGMVFLSSPAQAIHTHEQDVSLGLEPSFSNGEDIIPSGLHHYLDECLEKLGQECGPMFFTRIFMGQKNEIPVGCCQKLIDMGEECHDTITDTIISRPEFIANATLYETRAVDAWKMCST